MMLFPIENSVQDTPAPNLKIDDTKIRRDFLDTVDKSLIMVATYLWAEALKSLFTPEGLFKEVAHFGPWVVAILATFLAAVGTQFLSFGMTTLGAR